VTDAGTLQVWAPLVGKLIRFTMADASYAWAWVIKDLGANAARITVPINDALWNQVEKVLVGNEPYVVYSTTQVHVSDGIRIWGSDMDGSVHEDYRWILRYVDVQNDYTTNEGTPCFDSSLQQGAFMERCRMLGRVINAWCLTNCLASGSLTCQAINRVCSLFGGGAIASVILSGRSAGYAARIGHKPYTIQGFRLYCLGIHVVIDAPAELAIFDSTSDAITFVGAYVGGVSSLQLYGAVKLYGSGNVGWGMNMSSGVRFIHGGNLATVTIVGTAGEVNINGAATLMSDLEAAAGLVLPAASACVTWAQVAGAPFNGRVMNHNDGTYIGP
jgi:hypothetical protein